MVEINIDGLKTLVTEELVSKGFNVEDFSEKLEETLDLLSSDENFLVDILASEIELDLAEEGIFSKEDIEEGAE